MRDQRSDILTSQRYHTGADVERNQQEREGRAGGVRGAREGDARNPGPVCGQKDQAQHPRVTKGKEDGAEGRRGSRPPRLEAGQNNKGREKAKTQRKDRTTKQRKKRKRKAAVQRRHKWRGIHRQGGRRRPKKTGPVGFSLLQNSFLVIVCTKSPNLPRSGEEIAKMFCPW